LVDLFGDVNLPLDKILSKAKLAVGSHIHHPSEPVEGKAYVVGSVMNENFGESVPKRLLSFDTETFVFTSIPLPGRLFHKLKDPTERQLKGINGTYGAVRIVRTEPGAVPEWFESEAVIESEEAKGTGSDGVFADPDALDLANLLKAYSERKNVPLNDLLRGMELSIGK
ncbi:MAG: hypothetical protein WC291_12715, partial [Thermodesulfovibrionales bacterium]